MANNREKVLQLLESLERVSGLSVCIHDRTSLFDIPGKRSRHTSAPCLGQKKISESLCIKHDYFTIHERLKNDRQGIINTCPFGFTEIIVPLFHNDRFLGAIFGGTCWTKDSPPPHDDLIIPTDKNWLPDRLTMFECIAREISELGRSPHHATGRNRNELISQFISDRVNKVIAIEELASFLNLSESRTGHVIKELFGMTFPQLVNDFKLQEAIFLFTATDMTIGEVSETLNFCDQNYFSRLFKAKMGITPKKFAMTKRKHN